ncbi:MAG: DNA-binding NtrC family response regulator [bacterium]|jgi:DNA-binding NtrC family response regulator
MLPEMNGNEVLIHIRKEYAECQVILMTAYPSITLGVEAIKDGAFDFICKPFDMEQLLQLVKNAKENINLKQENQILRQKLSKPQGFSDLIGQSPKMKDVRQLIRQSASSQATVLITGQSGTGKEVVASTIHKNPPVHKEPFVAINCGAFPPNLIESELFGYEKGAFTGANKQTIGKFEQAQNGTIFLDEIGELPLEAQVKLLRVLQEKEVVRVGGHEPIALNIRIIAATNRNLQECIQEGTFREDLFFRIALFLIGLPPLNECGNDIVILAEHFLAKYSLMEKRDQIKLKNTAQKFLKEQPWVGNVRQLDNCIYRSILMNPSKTELDASDIKLLPMVQKNNSTSQNSLFQNEIIPLKLIEAKAVKESLVLTKGNVREASVKLEISRVTLYRKMEEYKIDKNGNDLN